jgi:hypothetical protein
MEDNEIIRDYERIIMPHAHVCVYSTEKRITTTKHEHIKFLKRRKKMRTY